MDGLLDGAMALHPATAAGDSELSKKDKTWMMGIGAEVDEFHSVTQIFPKEIIDIKFSGDLHDIDGIKAVWEQEQMQMAREIREEDSKDFSSIRYYAGADISFHKDDPDKAIATLAVFDRQTHRLVAEVSCMCRTDIPYLAGYLAYREAPILMAVLDLLRNECSQILPELIVCDGNGIWHPRWCGVASHFSLISGIPCIGVAKKILAVSALSREDVIRDMPVERGGMHDFVVDGRLIGTGFNSTGSVKSSMYISVGSGISLETTKLFIREVTKHKVVEPVRCADLVSRRILRTI